MRVENVGFLRYKRASFSSQGSPWSCTAEVLNNFDTSLHLGAYHRRSFDRLQQVFVLKSTVAGMLSSRRQGRSVRQ